MTRRIFAVLALSAICMAQSAARRVNAEQVTDAYMESIRDQRAELVAFLREMPKGGDLHNHLTGAVYAENYIRWGVERQYCIDAKTLIVAKPPCGDAQVPISKASDDPVLYRSIVDAWSMRNWQQSGQSAADHFFDAFLRFDALTYGTFGEMFAEVQQRAADNNVSYLELMIGSGTGDFLTMGAKTQWSDNFDAMRASLMRSGLKDAVARAIKEVDDGESKRDQILGCKTKTPATGCQITTRYILHVLRGFSKEQVFAQLLGGFELASADPRFVSLDLVMPEHSLVPMRDFALHMRMLDYFHKLYPKVHLTEHAGELAPGVVPPEGLRNHIRQTIETGHAERIGHGVDIMHENEPYALLRDMAKRDIMVEVCLTSNDAILGVTGSDHPLSTYMKYGVPVALATDDEGVARSEMTLEYMKGVQEQHLTYGQLKTMARTSLEHAFIGGASYWRDAKKFVPVAACAVRDSSECKAYMEANPRARLQGELERQFQQFEVQPRK